MAKNLKLNVKNAQLAEILKKGKKKPFVKSSEEEQSAPRAKLTKMVPLPPKKEEQKKPAPSKSAEAPKEEEKKEQLPPKKEVAPPVIIKTKEELQKEREAKRRPSSFVSAPLPHFKKEQEKAKAKEETKSAPQQKEGPFEEKAQPKKKVEGFKEYKEVRSGKKMKEQRFDSRDRQGLRSGDEDRWRKKRNHKQRYAQSQEEIIRPKELKIRLPITVKELAAEMKRKASELIASLFMQGMTVTLNDYLDDETTVELIGHELDCKIQIDTSEEEKLRITDKTIREEISESDPSKLKLRPPVITFMGHVDHGKTSLIDYIRKSNIASGESGAITQHIGAFKCHTPVGDLTILDTPGHEAFSAMRSRGADVTDIVVLVIAGDEGIRAQTDEAIKQAQSAKVSLVVAINKCDKPNFNAENIYRELSERELLPEAWGGQTITTNCSATTGEGIEGLLEMLALQAEILELKANPEMRARGSVIEAEMHKSFGAITTVLVQNGSLHLGDALVFDQHYGRVKTMHDDKGQAIKTAGPSTPIKITGLSDLPEAGSEFIVVGSDKEAKEIAEARSDGNKYAALKQARRTALENLLQKEKEAQERKRLDLIIRADVQGSLEALANSLQKIESTKAELRIVSSSVGKVTESDVELAAASGATILGFHTAVENRADAIAREKKVSIRLFDVIYHAVDGIKEEMRQLLDKVEQQNEVGEAEVKAVFKSSHLGLIAGCIVTEGLINRNHLARVIRDGKEIWKGKIASIKRVKDDVKEVTKGIECGILLHGFNDAKVGDVIKTFEITYHEQEL